MLFNKNPSTENVEQTLTFIINHIRTAPISRVRHTILHYQKDWQERGKDGLISALIKETDVFRKLQSDIITSDETEKEFDGFTILPENKEKDDDTDLDTLTYQRGDGGKSVNELLTGKHSSISLKVKELANLGSDIISILFEILIEAYIVPPYQIDIFSTFIIEAIKANDDTFENEQKRFLQLIPIVLDVYKPFLENDVAKSLLFFRNPNAVFDVPSTSHSYYTLFAFTLRQTPIEYIDDFLEYHKNKYSGTNYLLFLKGLIDEKEELFTKQQIKTVKKWVKIENKDPKIGQSEEEQNNETKFNPILGRLNKEKFATFLTFLCNETNGDTEPFLSKETVAKLAKNGLVLLKEGNELVKYEINVTAKKTLKTIYHCFYKLNESHSNNRSCKEQIANYLKVNFSNFDNLDINSLKNSMKSIKPPSMTFEISKYLP
jgi:hypothetical protein